MFPTVAFIYLFDDVINVFICVLLSIDSIRIHASVDIIFQEKVLECHQIFLLECDNHLVTEPERHQLTGEKDTCCQQRGGETMLLYICSGHV